MEKDPTQKFENTRYVKLQAKLRDAGLPDNLFAADYEERLAQAYERHARLLEWIREREREDPEFWCNLPWSPARKQFEEDVAAGIVHPFNPLVGKSPRWRIAMKCSLQQFNGSTARSMARLHKQRLARKKAAQNGKK